MCKDSHFLRDYEETHSLFSLFYKKKDCRSQNERQSDMDRVNDINYY